MSPLNKRRQAGVSIITAIFLIVVLAGLATAIVTFATGQQTSSTLDLLGARAYEVARSGLDYGIYRQNISGQCPASVSFNPTPAVMSPFRVTVQCVRTATPNLASVTMTQITATACNEPTAGGVCPNPSPSTPEYVQRVVTVQY